MKDRPQKPSTLGALVKFALGNWGLKILALALAILIYYKLKPSTTDEHPRIQDRNRVLGAVTISEHIERPATNTTVSAAKSAKATRTATEAKPSAKK